jgi:hypothetical protein
MSTVITIGGTAVSCPRPVIPRQLVAVTRRGIPTFSFSTRGGALIEEASDPYMGKEVTVTIGTTLVFTGDVIRRDVEFLGGIGWVHTYQCHGLRSRMDAVPHTDANDGSDSSSYNQAADYQSPDYRAGRAGRTVGEILEDVLTSQANADALDALDLGAYTDLDPVTLPTATTNDLDLLTLIPPAPVTVGGEKLGNAVEGFLAQWAPNHWFYVEPDGTFRVVDSRTFSASTLTINDDPIEPTPLSRDLSECFQRVVVRGQSIAEAFLFSTKLGTLLETPFEHDGLTIAQAKAAWTPDDFFRPAAYDEGTLTWTNTTTPVLTSSDATRTWAADEWDQTSDGRHGELLLTYEAGTSITMMASRRVTDNAALSAGGTSSFTVDRAVPHTNFDKYVLRGYHLGASAVWCEYALPSWAANKVARVTTYPFPFSVGSGNQNVTLTSTAIGSVCTSLSGDPPYNEAAATISVDVDSGTVRFGYPTYLAAGSKQPDDVRAMVPIWTGTNTAIRPADSGGSPVYTGGGNTVEGWKRTLTVTCHAWRDPANQSAMEAYAQDLLDSVKEPINEGTITYYGLYAAALVPGLALNIDGFDFDTGWESAALPVVEAQLTWGTTPSSSTDYTTTMRCSNRRAHFTDVAFLHPDRTGLTFDWSGELGPVFANYGGTAGLASMGDPMGAYQSFQGGYFDWGGTGGNSFRTSGQGGAKTALNKGYQERWLAKQMAEWDPLSAAMPELPPGGES